MHTAIVVDGPRVRAGGSETTEVKKRNLITRPLSPCSAALSMPSLPSAWFLARILLSRAPRRRRSSRPGGGATLTPGS